MSKQLYRFEVSMLKNLSMNIIGIDPGGAGAICVMRKSGVLLVRRMPETLNELYLFLKINSINSYCFLEKVWGIPGSSAGGMFTFGRGYGSIEMGLLVNKIHTEPVIPQNWMKVLGCGTKKGMTVGQWKGKLQGIAHQIYPSIIGLPKDIADAVLIAEYGRRKLTRA